MNALIFLSVALNFGLAFVIIRLISEKNELLNALKEIKKVASQHVKEPKKPETKPKDKPRSPLYMR